MDKSFSELNLLTPELKRLRPWLSLGRMLRYGVWLCLLIVICSVGLFSYRAYLQERVEDRQARGEINVLYQETKLSQPSADSQDRVVAWQQIAPSLLRQKLDTATISPENVLKHMAAMMAMDNVLSLNLYLDDRAGVFSWQGQAQDHLSILKVLGALPKLGEQLVQLETLNVQQVAGGAFQIYLDYQYEAQ